MSRPHRMPLLAFAAVLVLLAAACGDGSSDGTISGAAGTRPSLAGNWTLSAATIGGQSVVVPADRVIDLTIERGRIDGNAGCNGFGGSIDAGDDGTMRLDGLAMTEMACQPQALMDFETVYVQALSQADSWEAAPGALTLRGEGIELVYDEAQPAPTLGLEGTTWTFDTIFDGEGVERAASTPRLDKPEVTMVIEGGEAMLTSEDCGSITLEVNYEPGGEGNFLLADPTETIDCGDPESNMALALDGLAASTDYMIFESRLTFIGEPGETVSFTGSE